MTSSLSPSIPPSDLGFFGLAWFDRHLRVALRIQGTSIRAVASSATLVL